MVRDDRQWTLAKMWQQSWRQLCRGDREKFRSEVCRRTRALDNIENPEARVPALIRQMFAELAGWSRPVVDFPQGCSRHASPWSACR